MLYAILVMRAIINISGVLMVISSFCFNVRGSGGDSSVPVEIIVIKESLLI